MATCVWPLIMDSARVGQHEDQVIQIQKMRRISKSQTIIKSWRIAIFWEVFILACYDFRFLVSMLLTGNALPGLRKTLTAFVPRYFTTIRTESDGGSIQWKDEKTTHEMTKGKQITKGSHNLPNYRERERERGVEQCQRW